MRVFDPPMPRPILGMLDSMFSMRPDVGVVGQEVTLVYDHEELTRIVCTGVGASVGVEGVGDLESALSDHDPCT